MRSMATFIQRKLSDEDDDVPETETPNVPQQIILVSRFQMRLRRLMDLCGRMMRSSNILSSLTLMFGAGRGRNPALWERLLKDDPREDAAEDVIRWKLFR